MGACGGLCRCLCVGGIEQRAADAVRQRVTVSIATCIHECSLRGAEHGKAAADLVVFVESFLLYSFFVGVPSYVTKCVENGQCCGNTAVLCGSQVRHSGILGTIMHNLNGVNLTCGKCKKQWAYEKIILLVVMSGVRSANGM